MKLVSGPVRSGKGKKKAEKAARLVAREALRAIATDDAMVDAPKATKGPKAATKATVVAMEADN